MTLPLGGFSSGLHVFTALGILLCQVGPYTYTVLSSSLAVSSGLVEAQLGGLFSSHLLSCTSPDPGEEQASQMADVLPMSSASLGRELEAHG